MIVYKLVYARTESWFRNRYFKTVRFAKRNYGFGPTSPKHYDQWKTNVMLFIVNEDDCYVCLVFFRSYCYGKVADDVWWLQIN